MVIVLAENPERARAHLEQLCLERRKLAIRVARAPRGEKASYVAELKDLTERVSVATSALETSERRP